MASSRIRLGLNPEFLRFWIGQSISFAGSEITTLALPLTAVLVLHATPAQMGLLTAARNLPFLLVGLIAGVWVDRFRRRSLLIASDLAQAALLGSIPLAALMGRQGMTHLYIVAFLVGIVYVISMVAYQAFLPSLVERRQLTAGNSRLEVSSSVAQIAGPGLAGVLVQILTAPIAIVVDAVSFLISAAFLCSVRAPEPRPAGETRGPGAWTRVKEGLSFVWSHPLLRPIVYCGAVHNFFSTMIVAIYVVYVSRERGLPPAAIGGILACGGPGALLGALLAHPAARRFGLGPTVAASQVLTGLARLCIPLAGGPFAATVAVLGLSELLLGMARPIFNINQVSLRQAITADRMQGRVNATMRFLLWVMTPVGALAGGMLGTLVGLRATLFLASGGVLAASLWTIFSPLIRLREQPSPVAATPSAAR